MPQYAMVIDLDRCQGCRACVEACKVENTTPQGALWMHVFRLETGEYPNAALSFLPRPCQHCDNAPCVKVCPVGARFKREDGFVLTDFDRCIGCRYCELACPYGVNVFNWAKPEDGYYLDWDDTDVLGITGGVVPPYANPDHQELHGEEQRRTAGGGHAKGIVEKCTFCVHRVEKGLAPACVTTCPVNAIVFGDTDDPDDPIHRQLARQDLFDLLPEAGTEPRVHYAGGRHPSEHAREIERVEVEV